VSEKVPPELRAGVRYFSKPAEEYLQAMLESGLYGSSRAEVVSRLVYDGIRRAVEQRVIPRRYVHVNYNREREL
jgi:hypothetical protein